MTPSPNEHSFSQNASRSLFGRPPRCSSIGIGGGMTTLHHRHLHALRCEMLPVPRPRRRRRHRPQQLRCCRHPSPHPVYPALAPRRAAASPVRSDRYSFRAVPGDSSLTSRSIATASSALLSSDSDQTRSSTIVGIVLAVVFSLALAVAFRLHYGWRRRAARKRNSTSIQYCP